MKKCAWQDIRDNGMHGTIFATYFNILKNNYTIKSVLERGNLIDEFRDFIIKYKND